MSRQYPRSFKATQVFDWETEPKDERPTDFGRSTGFSTLSGYLVAPDSTLARRRQQERRRGFAKFIAVGLLILALSVAALWEMARWLKA